MYKLPLSLQQELVHRTVSVSLRMKKLVTYHTLVNISFIPRSASPSLIPVLYTGTVLYTVCILELYTICILFVLYLYTGIVYYLYTALQLHSRVEKMQRCGFVYVYLHFHIIPTLFAYFLHAIPISLMFFFSCSILELYTICILFVYWNCILLYTICILELYTICILEFYTICILELYTGRLEVVKAWEHD